MSGIDLSKLDDFIFKNEDIVKEIDFNSSKIIDILNEMTNSLNGKEIDFIFSKLCSQKKNLDNIMIVLESYLILLKSVRKSYVLQEKAILQFISRKIS